MSFDPGHPAPDSPNPNESTPPVRARVPDHVADGCFSSGAIVMTGPSEFIVDFLQTVGRLPSTIETEIMLGLAKPSPTTDDDNEEAETAVNHWTMIYQTLCQSVDFLYLN